MDKIPLEKVEVVFFMIIKNLEAMGLMNNNEEINNV